MTELKPCPFCGSPAKHGFQLLCSNDNCPNEHRDEQGATFITESQWNTRPIEDALQARIDALEALIIEADAQYCIGKQPIDFETASIALVRMCSEGAAALAENAALNAWHPASEPPEDERPVLIYWAEEVHVAYYDTAKNAYALYGMGHVGAVKNWRELPAPPETDV